MSALLKEIIQHANPIATQYLADGLGSVAIVNLPSAAARAIVLAIVVLASALALLGTSPIGRRALSALARDRHAWLAASPALFGLFLLVGVPFVVGVGLSPGCRLPRDR